MEERFSGLFDSETLLRAIGDSKEVRIIAVPIIDAYVIKVTIEHGTQVTDFMLDAE